MSMLMEINFKTRLASYVQFYTLEGSGGKQLFENPDDVHRHDQYFCEAAKWGSQQLSLLFLISFFPLADNAKKVLTRCVFVSVDECISIK